MDIYTHSQADNRLEIVDTGRRRRFSNSAKKRIVMESLEEPRLCTVTARRHGISRSQLYEWRRLARAGKLDDCDSVGTMVTPGFIPAVVTSDQMGAAASGGGSGRGRMEVVSANGRRVVVERDVDVEALLRLLRGLETLR